MCSGSLGKRETELILNTVATRRIKYAVCYWPDSDYKNVPKTNYNRENSDISYKNTLNHLDSTTVEA